MKPTFFATPEDLRAWFEAHAATERELWVGYHRKKSGRPSITWQESVDEALCVGWIDGLKKTVDADSYMLRFTPRQARSTWSLVNIRRVGELTAAGRMTPAGLAAFERRTDDRSAIYSYEQRHAAKLDPSEQAQLDANPIAAAFWNSQPPGYRRIAAHWVVSAVRPATRARRVATLIEESAAGRRIGLVRPDRAGRGG